MRIPKFNMIVTTLLIILVIGGIGFYNRPVVGIPDGEIGLEIGAPAEHVLQAGYPVVPLPVVLRLRNRTNAEIALKVKNPCQVFRYVVTTENGDFVQAMPADTVCTQQITTNIIRAQENIEELKQVLLDAQRYQPGPYQLHIKYWNYTAIEPFRLAANQ